ncbi:MAG: YiaA/YiaB family inner membrane protein [Accumulibacter sp.]|jgi:hypothetical protein|uniref:YiaA/YiaB family inner membrane protein n=1 Tax=Accumulibacter sp. TaxID=2053492 RepID=UPI002FC334C5
MPQKYLIRRDTPSWSVQVWLSFGLAVTACTIGIWHMPSQELDRAFLAVGFCFCLFASFTLAKMIRDNRDERIDTGAWVITVWAGFAMAVSLTAWGLFRMAIGDWEKAYMIVAWFFLLNTVFGVAKLVRDKQEADLLEGIADAEPRSPANDSTAK